MSKFKLVPEWREAWRLWSVQIAAVYATLLGLVTANADVLVGVLAILPAGPFRIVVGLLLGVALAAPAVGARILEQKDDADVE